MNFTAPLNCLTRKPVSYHSSYYGGDDEAKYHKGLAVNQQAREKIVEALGGKEACEGYPIVNIGHERMKPYLSLRNQDFPIGHAIIQGEDPAGRKYVGLRLKHRGRGYCLIETVFQRYRETSIRKGYEDGKTWRTRELAKFEPEKTIEVVASVFKGTHREYILAPREK